MTQSTLLDTKIAFIKGFADKTRLQILLSIQDQEKTVSQIVTELAGNQSNISQHLACLKECGIVTSRQEGKFTYYQLRNELIRDFLVKMDEVFVMVREEVECCPNNGLETAKRGGRGDE
ncbi:ArsR/SmtB family transcription factor [Brevibacillus dissolubilis]|uniref:ArsR/SmtB family transcription factor n=1 Tax=Brevibacillus dissolubilis TaxID=1844116 RepID=UPI001116FCB2|nr:metalloregulator ArsR/SmtB family transcription factor [Brevibacillus dissolubilis]